MKKTGLIVFCMFMLVIMVMVMVSEIQAHPQPNYGAEAAGRMIITPELLRFADKYMAENYAGYEPDPEVSRWRAVSAGFMRYYVKKERIIKHRGNSLVIYLYWDGTFEICTADWSKKGDWTKWIK